MSDPFENSVVGSVPTTLNVERPTFRHGERDSDNKFVPSFTHALLIIGKRYQPFLTFGSQLG